MSALAMWPLTGSPLVIQMSKILLVKEKHDTYVLDATNLDKAALDLVSERLSGYYDNWDDGDPAHQWQDRAEEILRRQDGKAAWRLLQERSDFEYESVELQDLR